jgi:hypothetical protein
MFIFKYLWTAIAMNYDCFHKFQLFLLKPAQTDVSQKVRENVPNEIDRRGFKVSKVCWSAVVNEWTARLLSPLCHLRH